MYAESRLTLHASAPRGPSNAQRDSLAHIAGAASDVRRIPSHATRQRSARSEQRTKGFAGPHRGRSKRCTPNPVSRYTPALRAVRATHQGIRWPTSRAQQAMYAESRLTLHASAPRGPSNAQRDSLAHIAGAASDVRRIPSHATRQRSARSEQRTKGFAGPHRGRSKRCTPNPVSRYTPALRAVRATHQGIRWPTSRAQQAMYAESRLTLHAGAPRGTPRLHNRKGFDGRDAPLVRAARERCAERRIPSHATRPRSARRGAGDGIRTRDQQLGRL